MKYIFDPPQLPDFADFVFYEEAFSVEEVDTIRKYWRDEKVKAASVAAEKGEYYSSEIRKTDVQFLEPTAQYNWIFERLSQCVAGANDSRYHFDLQGFYEPLQLARYTEGHFFDWHFDFGAGSASVRKISISIQLSDDEEYAGGDLQFRINTNIFDSPRKKGTVVVFPSFITHRVAPITRGTRFSIVAWISGRPFR